MNILSVMSIFFIVILCVVAYTPLNDRMNEADFQSLSYGPALANLLPVILASFAIVFSCVMLLIGSKEAKSK